MNNIKLSYLYSGKILSKEQELFLKKAKDKNLDVTLINISEPLTPEVIEQAKSCDIVYNDSGEESVLDIIKELEKNKILVLENSKSFEEDENKGFLFKKCSENNIPFPDTILLSLDIDEAKKQIIEFNRWPLILKRIIGTWGEYVEKAENVDEAINVINKFWIKGGEKLPIIAQEFIDSFSYRVTYIGKKIMQTAIKENNNWKCTGVYARNFKKFDIDPKLDSIIKKMMSTLEINVCGVDLLKKGDEWVVIEANSEPALDFFENETEILINEIIDLLVKKAIEHRELLKEKQAIKRARKIIKLLKNNTLSIIDDNDLKEEMYNLLSHKNL